MQLFKDLLAEALRAHDDRADAPRANGGLQLADPADHRISVNEATVLVRVVVDERDGPQSEDGIAGDFPRHDLPGLTRAVYHRRRARGCDGVSDAVEGSIRHSH